MLPLLQMFYNLNLLLFTVFSQTFFPIHLIMNTKENAHVLSVPKSHRHHRARGAASFLRHCCTKHRV